MENALTFFYKKEGSQKGESFDVKPNGPAFFIKAVVSNNNILNNGRTTTGRVVY